MFKTGTARHGEMRRILSNESASRCTAMAIRISGAASTGTRRHWLQSGAGAAAALLGSACAQPQGRGALTLQPPRGAPTFVLVHGAWYGGWCWQKLAPHLRAAGHAVHTPTLTGLGERAHLGSAQTGLDVHVQDVLALLDMEDLRDVILVGHSYAGFLIGSVAARAPARIRRLVYLDAFVPEAGRSLTDYLLPLERRQSIVETGRATGFIPPIPAQALGVKQADLLSWIALRVRPQPFATMSQAEREAPPPDMPRSYIACTSPASGSFGQFADRVRTDATWRYREIASGHNAMLIAPVALSALLLEEAAWPP